MEFRWRGHDVGESDLLIHQPGGEFDSFSKRNFKLLLISVPPEHLEAAARRLGVPFAGGALDGLEIITSASWIVNHLRYLVTTALEALVEGRSIPDVVEQRASNLLIQGLSPGIRIDPRIRRTRRHELMEAAVRLARDRAHEIHSVKDLSKASGGSERTLRRGFNERFGVSPKNYLQAQRLIGARRDLRSSGRGTTVSDIANRWGFWHMGQFAADYKRQFGELPSETLQRRLGFL
jgi:AraC-like DNA-binding protein